MIVLDASVIIALLWSKDSLHSSARRFFDEHVEQEFSLHAVTRAEVLVGPTRNGTVEQAMRVLAALEIRTLPLQESDVRRLADLRVRTGLKLPDACVILTAMGQGAAVATFDDRLRRAAVDLGLTALPEE